MVDADLFSGERSHSRSGAVLPVILLVTALLLSRYLTHAHYLDSLDAANYARALEVFDLARHSPHPPGYVLFVLLARLVRAAGVADACTVYLVVNAFMQVTTVLLAFSLFRRMIPTGFAILAVAAVICHPLYWYYGSTTNIYTAAAAITLAVAWAVVHHDESPSVARAVVLGFLLGFIGGFRQSSCLAIVPLVVWHLWRHRRRWRDWIATAVAAAAGVSLWLIPLLSMTGGWTKYRSVCAPFFRVQLAETSVLFSHNFNGVFSNAAEWMFAWSQVLWPLTAVIYVAATTRHAHGLTNKYSILRSKLFWLLWFVPASIGHLITHMGQTGYALVSVIPLVGLAITVATHNPTANAAGFKRLRVGLLYTVALEILWFTAAPIIKRPLPVGCNPRYLSQQRNWPDIAVKLYRRQAKFSWSGIRRADEVIAGYEELISRFNPVYTAVVYLSSRELKSTILEYDMPCRAILRGDWPSGRWVCAGTPPVGLELSTHSSLNEARLPPEIDTVLIINEASPLYRARELSDSVLNGLQKQVYALVRPDTLRAENLVVTW